MNFDKDIAASAKPVLLFFSAKWCGPSNYTRPDVEDALPDLTGVKYYEIDIEQHPDIAQRLQVKALPWLALVKDGQCLGSRLGTVDGWKQVVAWTDGLLNPPEPTKKKRKGKK